MVSAFSYTHDRAGNRLSKTVTDWQENPSFRYDYTYDTIYQLLESMPTKITKHKERRSPKKRRTFLTTRWATALTAPAETIRQPTMRATSCLKAKNTTINTIRTAT